MDSSILLLDSDSRLKGYIFWLKPSQRCEGFVFLDMYKFEKNEVFLAKTAFSFVVFLLK